MLREFGMAAKWLELLKDIGQGVTRVAVLRNPAIAQGGGQLGAIQAVAASFKVELIPIDIRVSRSASPQLHRTVGKAFRNQISFASPVPSGR